MPATEAYFGRVGTIVFNTLVPELSKRPERLNGRIKVSLLIDRKGHIQVEKVSSTTSNRWVEDTTLRVVRTVKLPSMPSQVIAEQGHEPVHFEAEWSFERQGAEKPKRAATAYAGQTSGIAREAVVSQLLKHPERVHHVVMTLQFEIDERGRIHNVKIISHIRNAWAEDTARRALSALKLPPPSKQVFEELGTATVHVQAELDIDVQPAGLINRHAQPVGAGSPVVASG